MKRILILGASGLVGSALVKELNEKFIIYGTYHSKEINDLDKSNQIKFDLNEFYKINQILDIIEPDIIISSLCGDYNKQLLLYKELEKYLQMTDKKFILCSSANVYDNDLSQVHFESDTVDSNSDYGLFKIKCESFKYKNFCIVRFPFIWGVNSERIKNIILNIKNNLEIDIYENLLVSNTLDIFIAREMLDIIENDIKGVYHIATTDIIEHKHFMTKLLAGLGYNDYKLKTYLYEKNSYLAILSERDKKIDFQIDNEYIINYLCGDN
ncbi:MAG: sugar nucleotide-binding protein [Sarcina sp.]